jgi:hypothetical protein
MIMFELIVKNKGIQVYEFDKWEHLKIVNFTIDQFIKGATEIQVFDLKRKRKKSCHYFNNGHSVYKVEKKRKKFNRYLTNLLRLRKNSLFVMEAFTGM